MKVIFLQTYVNHIEKDQRGSSTSLWAKKNSIVISVYTVTAARIIMISTYAVIAASIGQIRYKQQVFIPVNIPGREVGSNTDTEQKRVPA